MKTPYGRAAVPAAALAAVLAVVIASPGAAFAGGDAMSYPEIAGTVTAPEDRAGYAAAAQVTLAGAMTAAEEAVADGEAVWGKLGDVQGFLVYKVGVEAGGMHHKVLIDAGTAEALYVSEGYEKMGSGDDRQCKKKGDASGYGDTKKQQWAEVRDAFHALPDGERAAIMAHFVSVKSGPASDERDSQMDDMRSMITSLLPLPLEDKVQKLSEYASTL